MEEYHSNKHFVKNGKLYKVKIKCEGYWTWDIPANLVFVYLGINLFSRARENIAGVSQGHFGRIAISVGNWHRFPRRFVLVNQIIWFTCNTNYFAY